MKRTILAILTAVLGVGACGGSSASSAPVLTAAQLESRAGLAQCGPDTSQDMASSGVKPTARHSCQYKGETVGVETYRSPSDFDQAMAVANSKVVCNLLKGFGRTHVPVITGPTWSVAAQTATTDDELHKKLGAGAITYVC